MKIYRSYVKQDLIDEVVIYHIMAAPDHENEELLSVIVKK